MKYRLLLLIAMGVAIHAAKAQQKGYYRTPAISKDIVVFSAEGDLWKYDRAKGITSRLTTHPGLEEGPKLSPDGKQILFIGEYDGVPELYLMSVDGSVPKRITYGIEYNYIHSVGWSNDGKILFTTSRYNLLPDPQLVKIDPNTLAYEIVPLSQVSDACYDESNMLFFSRLPKQGSNNKRYKGGTIEQIWKFDGTHEATCLTCDFDGTSYHPMLYNGRIYFASDRDGSMNIWSMDKDGKNLKQHTFSKEWDIKSPSNNGSEIIYQKGADLWVFDIDANKEKMLDINLTSDFDQRKPRWIKNPSDNISAASISPDGNFVALISRGRLFVAPSNGERWLEITRKSGIRLRDVHFLTNRSLLYTSDESGEVEIWKALANGTGKPQQLTKNSKVLITNIKPSPNGKWIAYADKDQVIKIIDTSGVEKFAYRNENFGIGNFSWSKDGKYFSFDQSLENNIGQVGVVEVEAGKNVPVTSNRLDSYDPSWTSDNHWLYFISDRNFHTRVYSPWGPRQPEPYYTETTNIYALQLDSADKFPFIQQDPWTPDTSSTATDEKEKPKDAKDSKNAKEAKPAEKKFVIDWQESARRLFRVPVKSGNIRGLSVADGYLYWLQREPGVDGSKLYALKIEFNKKMEPTEVASGVSNYILADGRKKILVVKGKTFAVADANGTKIDFDKNKIEMANWIFKLDPVDDWKQMFSDAWRMMRDYFYDRNMHHVDWNAVRKQYEPLVDRVTDRDELDDVLAQMVSELSALHTFVFGGDKRRSPDVIPTGSLGARLSKDFKGYKIEHMYRTDPDYPEDCSPLCKPELNIHDGDIITAVNDIPVSEAKDISELLANKIGVPVKLNLLNQKQVAYSEIVRPISGYEEYMLRYNEWELNCRQKVDDLAKGAIGYVHLKDMVSEDMDEFIKQYYPVFNRKGLIIDMRHNGGGNIDSWVLEKLMRKAWFYWQDRTGKPYWNMQYAFRGHMVVLCDQFTASDGEAFTEGFRRLGLGKVIGMRTWGGEIWLSADNRLVDNGIATAAESGVFGPEGKWLIEGHGVDPDIIVDNLPHETFAGKDAQLEAAIDYLKKEIEKNPVEPPKAPPYPDKSFKYTK